MFDRSNVPIFPLPTLDGQQPVLLVFGQGYATAHGVHGLLDRLAPSLIQDAAPSTEARAGDVLTLLSPSPSRAGPFCRSLFELWRLDRKVDPLRFMHR